MQNREKGFSKLELLAGAIGVSPIPVLGEICGTAFIYKILKETPFGKEKGSGILISAAVTVLMRMQLYTSIYAPIYKKLSEYLS